MNMKTISSIFNHLVSPKSKDSDSARKEFILNILLISLISLLAVASVISSFNFIVLSAERSQNNSISLAAILLILAFFISLYFLSRKGFSRWASYIFVCSLFFLPAYLGFRWGVDLPAEIIFYSVIIVISGVLIGSRFAFLITFFICATIAVTGYLHNFSVVEVNRHWTSELWVATDMIVASVLFFIVAIVSWLSNREIEKSLKRARRSEAELQKEKDLLEIKVEERTKELKKLEAEKIMHLYRFAEFGRLSAGLFHDLINPLNAVSLSIERLKVNDESVVKAIKAAKKMEDLVVAVRKQISRQDNKNLFSFDKEIQDVIDVLSYKARKNNVEIRFLHEDNINFWGNAIRFNQAVLNLIVNAIDSYSPQKTDSRKRAVDVSLKEDRKEITMSVKDFGSGISRENLEKIFEPFFTTKDYGVGIGLSMAKQIIEKDFYGKLIVESDTQLGQSGSVFTTVIPKINEC